ncbi:MAG: EamA family transporter [Victivallaceae bacterium]|nr:EamA family transporter [Victivallaceae bacterium]
MKTTNAATAYSRGVFLAVAAAVAYGTNPLFALPLYADGFDADTMLLLRYIPAALLLGGWMLLKKESFRMGWRELVGAAVCGQLFSLSSLFLFLSYRKMDAGVASTLLFVYPMMVALIMAIGFREKSGAKVWIGILLSLGGVALLCRRADGAAVSGAGLWLVMLSALSYAIYMVAVNRSGLRGMPAVKLTFYVVLFGSLLYLVRLRFGVDIKGEFNAPAWLNIAGIALFPSVISMTCTTLAIQRIGATVTAIFGALEPVTAVVIGVTLFEERLSVRIVLGIALILVSVVLAALDRRGGRG